MQNISRFLCPSSSLDLGDLLRKARTASIVSLGLAVVVHFSTTAVGLSEDTQKAVKPLTTQFIKRQPRLTKPLEMKKKPRPRQRRIQREMVAVQAKVSRQATSTIVHPTRVLQSLARPDVSVARSTIVAATDLEPAAIAARIGSTKDPKDKVDMSLEMLGIESLDTGRYQAMVIQNPSDKRDIAGFFHMYVGYSVQGWSNDSWMHGGYFERPTALPRVVEAINRYTGIKATYEGAKPFTAPEVAKIPWLYTSVDAVRAGAFRITKAEALSLGTYMISGGFFFVEDAWPEIGGVCDRTARSMIQDALAAVNKPIGRDWSYEIIPRSHPIYYCFFEFPGGPPKGLDKGSMNSPVDGLEGVHINDRLVAIFSGNDYEDIWAGPGTQFGYMNPERQYQFGVNLVVYALTQEGSITYQVMNAVNR